VIHSAETPNGDNLLQQGFAPFIITSTQTSLFARLRIQLSRSEISRRRAMPDSLDLLHIHAPSSIVRVFHVPEPGIAGWGSILTPSLAYTFWNWVDPSLRICDPRLLFSSSLHGYSLRSLISRCEHREPLLVLIKCDANSVFGAIVYAGHEQMAVSTPPARDRQGFFSESPLTHPGQVSTSSPTLLSARLQMRELDARTSLFRLAPTPKLFAHKRAIPGASDDDDDEAAELALTEIQDAFGLADPHKHASDTEPIGVASTSDALASSPIEEIKVRLVYSDENQIFVDLFLRLDRRSTGGCPVRHSLCI